MYPTLAPYLDAMPPLFYQYFWPFADTCVTKTLLDFLNKGIVQPNLNETLITLIPKTKILLDLQNFALLAYVMLCIKWFLKLLQIG